jgi:ATP-dependent RNA/DNA helicase IGHMBP2
VERLLNAGLCETDIAIITPYNGQVEILRTMLLLTYPKLEIRSVDGFQGCEKEAVILSLVRSNLKGEVGFLADDRRLNVAVTRARKQCTIVCNTETVSNHRFIKDLIQWFEDKGDYRSAFEFISATKSVISPPTSASSVSEKVKYQGKIIENPDPTKVTSRIRKKDVTNSARIQVSKLSITASKHEQMENEGIVKPEHTYHEEPLQGRGSLHREDLKNTLSSNPEVGTATEEETQCSTLSQLYSETAKESCDDDGNTTDIIREDKRLIHPSNPGNDASNQLLMDLSKERMQRIQMKAEDTRKLGVDVKVSYKGKDAQSKGKRLGREPKSQVMAKGGSKEKLDADEVLDDMDFLDRQIAEVQNSHGRNIEGSGTTYRTIVNGILLSRPTRTPQKVTESKASQVLKEKLRQAEQNRKVKPKKRAK